MTSSEEKAIIVLTLAVLLLVLEGIYTLVSHDRSTPAPTIVQTSERSHTSQFETYRDVQYGFAVTYPADWVSTSTYSQLTNSEDGDVRLTLWSPTGRTALENTGEAMPLFVSVLENQKHLNFDQWYDTYDPGPHMASTSDFVTNAGAHGFLIRPSIDAGIADCCQVIFVPIPGNSYYVKVVAGNLNETERIARSLTFTGTKYSSQTLGISFNIPVGMMVDDISDTSAGRLYIHDRGEEFPGGGLTVTIFTTSIIQVQNQITQTLSLASSTVQSFGGNAWTVNRYVDTSADQHFIDAFLVVGSRTYQVGGLESPLVNNMLPALLTSFTIDTTL